jgi:outer membrane PBP1 activator LpoA protein
MVFFISSCSSQAPTNKTQKTPNKTEITQIEIKLTSNDMLEQAKSLFTRGNQKEAVTKLINASKLLFLQGQNTNNDYAKALWLADKVLSVTSKNQEGSIGSSPLDSYALMLIRAKSLFALGYTEPSYQQLKAIYEFSKQNNLPLTLSYYQTQSKVWDRKNRPVESLQSELHAFSLQKNLTTEEISNLTSSIWNKLIVLTPWQIELFSNKSAPLSKGWLALIKLANQSGNQFNEFQSALVQWQARFPVHPANIKAQQLLLKEAQTSTLENIAILLPLSGPQKLAGITAQQGILAAYQSNSNIRLHFLDTHTLDWTTLNQNLATLAVDFVIGPILKQNLSKYLLLDQRIETSDINTDATTNVITKNKITNDIKQIPTLLLNVPKKSILASNIFALSMRPEDEGTQAAASLSNKEFKNPIVLSHNDAVSKRIAQAFIEQWYVMTQKAIDLVYFESGKIMQKNIKASLDVSESEIRIKELKNNLKYTLKTQSRNRRDVDMIYLVGSAKETRLVKPYIEVNISPFAKSIPVYASSRSHSMKSDNNSNNDLQGLTFTEVPWLLNSELQNKKLAKISKELWPRRSDSLSRIFALGFDSYQLINSLPLMKEAPYIRHYGQTGILQLGIDGVLNRTLLWGQYKRGKVVEIEIN